MKDEWFNEICLICRKEKLVHNDCRSSYDNPSFICKDCERVYESWEVESL